VDGGKGEKGDRAEGGEQEGGRGTERREWRAEVREGETEGREERRK
jgi:hypothetical protein